MRIDYYRFDVFQPYKLNGECHKSLREAKGAYLKHLAEGHRLGCSIYGYNRADDCTALSFTSWYSDARHFSTTRYTNIGRAAKNEVSELENNK